ncbi:GGDEF domain-containing protein [Pseudomonas sp. PDNC002]|uniref:GGDEF domain-containing protein n=1 Tax=Pseudomonas sp. PDNC002 TaxID=2811422 RepID=UPI0019668002|nr:sensor domain-containing diguanylate cyclase [Pseudomonas sp. PDNC002]QRY81821.1 GGDEF domain-containing protein [Pseudomonas sp. PDNC002]
MESLYFSPMLLGLNLMLASAIACTGLWYFARPYRGPGLWMSGAWTLIVGILLFMGFMASGNKLLNILGNATQLAGEALLLLGVYRFLGLPPPWWTVPASAAAMTVALSWHWWVAPINSEYLIAIYAGIGGLLPIQACLILLRTQGEIELRGVRRFVAAALGAYALVTLARSGIGLHDGLHGIEHVDVTRSFSYLLPYNFGVPLWVIALVGMALMTMRRILADSQRHARDAAASAERFERLMQVAHAGMLVLRDGKVVDANPMLERMLLWPRERLIGQDFSELFVGEVQEDLHELLAAADGKPHDILAMRDDGSTFAAELSVERLAGGQQRVAEIRDVSHHKALENQLRQLATLDPLTSALNRRAFQAQAEHELARSARYGSPLSLAILDLDHFKRINDQYGHAAGDRALCQFSELCRRLARSTDLFARFGGEEFVFLLPSTDADAARHFLDRLRENLQSLRLDVEGGELRVSVSIGLVSVEQACDLAQLLEGADRALYQAKANGRNRLESAQL